MIYTDNALNILTTKTYKGIGRAWITKNLRGGESVSKIVSLLSRDSKDNLAITIARFENDKAQLQQTLKKLEGFADGLIAIGDALFPPYRGKVKHSEQPVFLFYRGDINLLMPSNQNIAVIGLLNPDHDIEIIEKQIVNHLVINGATIVSGLALGCDTIAHKQALDSKGKTIAILPSPLNDILPKANLALANEIVEKKGLLISEYCNPVKSNMELSGRYQERDRLQALFSDYIILSASYAQNDQGNDSGSRLAMAYALTYEIPRAVIYDDKRNDNNPKYDLNRQLIQEEKAIMVINNANHIVNLNKILAEKTKTSKSANIQSSLFD